MTKQLPARATSFSPRPLFYLFFGPCATDREEVFRRLTVVDDALSSLFPSLFLAKLGCPVAKN